MSADKERRREYNRKYYLDNKKELAVKKRQHYLANREYYDEKTRQWNRNNPEKHLIISRRQRKKLRDKYVPRLAKLDAIKLKYGCCNPECKWCGSFKSVQLDFHHVDPSTKLFTIGGRRLALGNDKIVAEINKCTVLCAVCHRDVDNLDCSKFIICTVREF